MAENAPLFYLIAGEASGDLLGARLMRGLKKLTHGHARFIGIGGPRMRAEGIELLFPQEELAHFGLTELLTQVPHLLHRMQQTVEQIEYLHPAALITIDAPDFCFRVAKKLKGKGIPLIHYVAPTVWAWRPGRAHTIAQFLDHLLVLLPFEPPYFIKEGLGTTFTGHPIVESGADKGDAARFRARYGMVEDIPLLSVLPGSRMSEVTKLMPIFKETVAKLRPRYPNMRCVIPVTSNVAEFLETQIRDWPVPVTIITGDEDKYDAFAASRAALCCSGTVAVELAMAKLPAVTAYKISETTHFLYRNLIKAKYANIVNIMHDRMVVPELIQHDCTPEKLASAIDKLFTSDISRNDQIKHLGEVAGWLGAGQFVPSERAAETVLMLAREAGGGKFITANPYTVLQVVPALVTGGVERGTVEVAAALTSAGHRAIVASAGGPMAKEIENIGGIHVQLPLDTKNPITMYRNTNRLVDIIQKYNVDIVHARSRAPAWSAYAASIDTGRPFVTTFHNAYGDKNALKRMYNAIMARGERVIAISNFVGDHAASTYNVSREKLRVIARGVDTDRFNPSAVGKERIETLRKAWQLPANAPVIMLPGRLSRWKGHLVLIEALKRLSRSDVICLIIGAGSSRYRKEVEEAIYRANLDTAVRLIDDCRDMPAGYMLADIVVSPSTRPEGFGRVIAEAQAMGKPVIATDHGGARETVIPNQTGWLIPPHDATALANAINKVLSLSSEEREKLAKQATSHIRTNFTTAQMTEKTLAVYEEVRKK